MAKFCSNCGRQLSPNALFCPNCGKQMSRNAAGAAGNLPANGQMNAGGWSNVPQGAGNPSMNGRMNASRGGYPNAEGQPNAEYQRPNDQNYDYRAGQQNQNAYGTPNRNAGGLYANNTPNLGNPNQRKKGMVPVIAAVLVVALLFTAIGYPGYLRKYFQKDGKGEADGGSGISGISGVSVEDDAVSFGGHSKAFSVEPVKGITVSAKENALDKDRDVKITAVDTAEAEELAKLTEESGELMLGCYDISLGLEDDECLPGTFKTEIDISSWGFDEETCKKINVYRLDAQGDPLEYSANVENGKISFNSSQNSTIVIAVGIICALAPFAALRMKEGVQSTTEFFGSKIPRTRKFWSQGQWFKLYWLDEETERQDEAKRMKMIEQTALEAAREEIKKKSDNETEAGSPGGLFELFRKSYKKSEENTAAVKLQQESLAKNKEYQKYKKNAEKDRPASILEIENMVNLAAEYLASDRCKGTEKLKLPSYTVEIVCHTKGNGAETWHPALKKAWVEIGYNGLVTGGKKGEKDGYKIDKDNRDDILLSITHELFHVCQDGYYTNWADLNLKFSEMTADYLEHDAYEYFKASGEYTTAYKDLNSIMYEAYGYSMDDHSIGEDPMKAEGYTLAKVLEALNKTTGKEPTATTFVENYKATGRVITKTIQKTYGLSMEEFKKKYKEAIASLHSDLLERQQNILNGTVKDKNFPEKLLTIKSQPRSAAKIDICQNSFACRLSALLPLGVDSEYAALFVRDKNLNETVKDFEISFSEGESCSSRYGEFIRPRKDRLYYKELYTAEKEDKSATSSYTVYMMSKPNKPAVEIKEKELTVSFSGKSKAAQDGYIDNYILRIKKDDNVIKEIRIPKKDWDKGYSASLESLGIAKGTNVGVTVQECIDASDKYPECLGPESDPAVAEASSQAGPIKSGIKFKEVLGLDKYVTATLSVSGNKINISVPSYSAGGESRSGFTITGVITSSYDKHSADSDYSGTGDAWCYQGKITRVSDYSKTKTESTSFRDLGTLTERTTTRYTGMNSGTFAIYYDPTGYTFPQGNKGWTFVSTDIKGKSQDTKTRRSSSGKVNETITENEREANPMISMEDGGN